MKPAFLVMDKPPGITSHDVVAVVRAVTGLGKVGHTGTLDPFATGVLPLALGPATKLIRFLDEDHKVYDATIALGQETDTGDPTGEVIRTADVPVLSEARVRAVLEGFSGIRQQRPPRHSAVKVKGRPLYSYARAGEDVEAAPRPVRIDGIELVSLAPDSLRVRITCGRGTYARVLAVEIADQLGTAGHLSELRREESGLFTLGHSVDMATLSQMVAGRPDWAEVLRPARGEERVQWRPRDDVRADLAAHWLPAMTVLSHLPLVNLGPGVRAALANGAAPPAPPDEDGRPWLLLEGDELVGIGVREGGGLKTVRLEQDRGRGPGGRRGRRRRSSRR